MIQDNDNDSDSYNDNGNKMDIYDERPLKTPGEEYSRVACSYS